MNYTDTPLFIDTGFSRICHHEEKACGDAVAFKRIPEEDRLISVLADGLGHGLKANILALMTTTMALRFSAEDREIVHSAEIIMDSLPVCQVRKISYATFTIVDTRLGGLTKVVEMGNPPFVLFRDGEVFDIPGKEFASPKYSDRTMTSYKFQARSHDRLIFFSDGVTQSGLGTASYPLGWGDRGVRDYIKRLLTKTPGLSAQELSLRVMREAVAHEPFMRPMDDISCACISFRTPKKMLVFTGPPFEKERDAECARIFRDFPGTKAIAGGSSAEIIARELNETLETDLSTMGELPPISYMKSADLVTEGIFTLSKTATYLEDDIENKPDAAGMLAELLRNNDIIEFLVGTRINDAHQDPNLPVDLELRRNIIKRIANALRNKYMKEVNIRFV